MTINYDGAKTLSIAKMFDGTTEDGRKFTVTAEWNEWDEWVVTSIDWENPEATEEEEESIEGDFYTHMLN